VPEPVDLGTVLSSGNNRHVIMLDGTRTILLSLSSGTLSAHLASFPHSKTFLQKVIPLAGDSTLQKMKIQPKHQFLKPTAHNLQQTRSGTTIIFSSSTDFQTVSEEMEKSSGIPHPADQPLDSSSPSIELSPLQEEEIVYIACCRPVSVTSKELCTTNCRQISRNEHPVAR
jgi:hypothetical protein